MYGCVYYVLYQLEQFKEFVNGEVANVSGVAVCPDELLACSHFLCLAKNSNERLITHSSVQQTYKIT